MRLDGAGPRTWLLAGVAGWALLAWLLAVAGMGGRIAPLDDDPALVRPVPSPAPPADDRLGPPGQYAEIGARPLLSTTRRAQPFSLVPEQAGAQAEERFEFVLTGVLLTPDLQMAILQPVGGGDSVRLRVGAAPEGAPSWRLVEVSPRSAVFAGPGGQSTLPLRTYDGGADLRAPVPMAAAMDDVMDAAAQPMDGPMAADAMPDDAGPEADMVEEADAPTPEAQMDAIRKRIQARREQLRREARQPVVPPPPPPPTQQR